MQVTQTPKPLNTGAANSLSGSPPFLMGRSDTICPLRTGEGAFDCISGRYAPDTLRLLIHREGEPI